MKLFQTDMKVVITLPLQAVSTGSEWFNSSADRVPGYEHRVVWNEGTVDNVPPVSSNI